MHGYFVISNSEESFEYSYFETKKDVTGLTIEVTQGVPFDPYPQDTEIMGLDMLMMVQYPYLYIYRGTDSLEWLDITEEPACSDSSQFMSYYDANWTQDVYDIMRNCWKSLLLNTISLMFDAQDTLLKLNTRTYYMNFLCNRQKPFQEMEIWTSDYCPKKIDDIIGNDTIKHILNKYLEAKHLPNILLTGSHGTCKRTFARLVVKTYLGEDYDRGCLSVDGAVCRGKDVISTNQQKKVATDKQNSNGPNVLDFTKTQLSLGGKKKIIIIYNFEDMTNEAQNALRRIMETNSSTTRFILICNNLDNIIEAIQSRCVPLCTNLLTIEESKRLISTIMEKRGLPPLSHDIVEIINMLADGDVKKIINYIQTISVNENITIDMFHEIFNVPPIKLLEQMLIETQRKETQHKALEKVTFMLNQGYNYGDILEMLSKILAYSECIPEGVRMVYLEELAKYYCEMTLYTNCVHLYALFSKFCT